MEFEINFKSTIISIPFQQSITTTSASGYRNLPPSYQTHKMSSRTQEDGEIVAYNDDYTSRHNRTVSADLGGVTTPVLVQRDRSKSPARRRSTSPSRSESPPRCVERRRHSRSPPRVYYNRNTDDRRRQSGRAPALTTVSRPNRQSFRQSRRGPYRTMFGNIYNPFLEGRFPQYPIPMYMIEWQLLLSHASHDEALWRKIVSDCYHDLFKNPNYSTSTYNVRLDPKSNRSMGYDRPVEEFGAYPPRARR